MFKDVRPDDWAAKSIDRVAKAGRMVGDPGGMFRPDDPITRREMASILDRMMAWDGSFKDVLPDVMPAVIALVFNTSLGSGFYVSPQGYIVTNRHVADISPTGALTIIKDGMPSRAVKVVAISNKHDLALLKDTVTPPAWLKLAAKDVQLGDHVGVVGAPKGYTDTFTQGQVSHTRRAGNPVSDIVDCFQTDAPINPGNSGGPVINEAGEVAGVVCSKFVSIDTEGMAWAIHARYVREFLAKNGVVV